MTFYKHVTPIIALCCALSGCSDVHFKEEKEYLNGQEKSEQEPLANTSVAIYQYPMNGSVVHGFTEIGRPKVGGRTRALVVDYTDSTHLVAVASDGGIWRSQNRGQSWQVVNDRLPSLVMTDIEQDPFDPLRFYAAVRSVVRDTNGTYFSSIYVSDDGAQSFNVLPTLDSTNKVTYASAVICSPTSPNTLYVLMDDNVFFQPRRIMRSLDGGLSYQRVFDTDQAGEPLYDIHFDSNGTLYALGAFHLFKSATGNAGSFSITGDSLLFAHGFGRIRTAPSNDSIIYVIGRPTNSGSLRTTKSINSGLSWDSLGAYSSGALGMALSVHPTNPDILFNGGTSLKISIDGGTTFETASFNGIDNWDIVFDKSGKSVYQVNDQGMARLSIDPLVLPIYGNSGIDLDSNLRNQRLHHGDFHKTNSSMLLGVQDDGSNWTASSTARFKGLGGGDGGYCYFHQQDTSTVYTSTQNGGLRRINDIYGWPIGIGPQNFDNILNQLDQTGNGRPDEGALFINPFWVNYSNGDQLYYQTKKRVWRSVDRGDNWEPFTPSYDHLGFRSYMQIDGHSASNPLLYYSVENVLFAIKNAATADSNDVLQFTTPHNILDLKVSYQNDSTLFLANTLGSASALSKVSGMMGPNPIWTDITGDLPMGVVVRCIQASSMDENRIAVGAMDGLYVSEDGGQHWCKDSLFPNVEIRRMRVRPSDDRLFLFTYGRGPWSADFSSVSTSLKPFEKNQVECHVFPNPTSNSFAVQLSEKHQTEVLYLYDSTGKLVLKTRLLGQANFRVDVNHLHEGTYMALIEGSEGLIASKRLLIIR